LACPKESAIARIVYISGPSGMAKTRIKEKMEQLAVPLGFKFERVVAATSRPIRPNESEGNPWYFKSISEIQSNHLADPGRFLAVEVRSGEWQGLDMLNELKNKLAGGGTLWCELHIRWLEEIERWIEANVPDTRISRVFVSPLSEGELQQRASAEHLTWEKVIESEVHKRLLARKTAGLDNATPQKMRQRARDAAAQFARRHEYDCIVVNHQGEESLEWGATNEFPTGEAARVLEQILRIFRG
jgi:guanylate kinase